MLFGIDKKIFIIGLLTLFILAQMACGQSAVQKEQERISQVAKHEEAAKQFREKGDFQSALQEQQKAVDLNPDDDESLMLLGGIYIELKQYDKAIEVLERGKQINEKNVWIHYELALAFGDSNNKQKAVQELREAIELSPQNVKFITNLGALYGEINDQEKERESYEKALAINPNYPDAIYNLALLEAEENNKEKAVELFKKFIEKSSPTEDAESIERAKAKIKELEQSKR